MLGSQGKGARVQPISLTITEFVGWECRAQFCSPRVPGCLRKSRNLIGCPIWGKGCYWHLVVEARSAAQHPHTQDKPLQEKCIQPKMSVVLRMRIPALLSIDSPNQPAESAAVRGCLGIW